MRINQRTLLQARRLYKECLTNGMLDEQKAKRLIQELCKKPPRNLLPLLIALYKYFKIEEERCTVKIYSAVDLDERFKQEIQGLIQERFKPIYRYEFIVDPTLIGGMVIRIGSRLIDLSIKGQLMSLVEQTP